MDLKANNENSAFTAVLALSPIIISRTQTHCSPLLSWGSGQWRVASWLASSVRRQRPCPPARIYKGAPALFGHCTHLSSAPPLLSLLATPQPSYYTSNTLACSATMDKAALLKLKRAEIQRLAKVRPCG